ncbi:hypothetical protein HMPREF0208_02046 [Citrobacter koseri]|nr:hypothetical protein HMPREF0208_02046 [Citrobacter koseri]
MKRMKNGRILRIFKQYWFFCVVTIYALQSIKSDICLPYR